MCVCDLAGGLENVNPLPPPQGSVSPGKTPNSRPSDVIRTLVGLDMQEEVLLPSVFHVL